MTPAVETQKVRVFVVDDHPIVRQGLTQLIERENDLMVCGQAEGARATLDSLNSIRPDIMILDISLEGPDGIELLKEIRLRDSSLPVLILSMHDESLYAERALRAGAHGYIMKHEATDKVLTAIRCIIGGEIYVSDRLARHLVQRYMNSSSNVRPCVVEDLSTREREVFRLVGQGLSTREIAETLHLSVKTVETHYAHIKEKLCLKNTRALVHYAADWLQRDRQVE